MDEITTQLRALDFPTDIVTDGKPHRFDRSGKQTGWYIAHSIQTPMGNHTVVYAGDWKTGEKYTFKSGSTTSDTTLKNHFLKQQKTQAATHHQVARQAQKLWQNATSSGTSGYVRAKGIMKPLGCRFRFNRFGYTELLVPCIDENNFLWGYQSIAKDGKKLFLKGQKKSGTFCPLPNFEALEKTDRVLICEGWATGMSLYEASGIPVVRAFDAANIIQVASALRKKFPEIEIYICGDDDQSNAINVGRQKATQAAKLSSAKVIFPDFSNKTSMKSLTDFNDLMQVAGEDEVLRQLMKVIAS